MIVRPRAWRRSLASRRRRPRASGVTAAPLAGRRRHDPEAATEDVREPPGDRLLAATAARSSRGTTSSPRHTGQRAAPWRRHASLGRSHDLRSRIERRCATRDHAFALVRPAPAARAGCGSSSARRAGASRASGRSTRARPTRGITSRARRQRARRHRRRPPRGPRRRPPSDRPARRRAGARFRRAQLVADLPSCVCFLRAAGGSPSPSAPRRSARVGTGAAIGRSPRPQPPAGASAPPCDVGPASDAAVAGGGAVATARPG